MVKKKGTTFSSKSTEEDERKSSVQSIAKICDRIPGGSYFFEVLISQKLLFYVFLACSLVGLLHIIDHHSFGTFGFTIASIFSAVISRRRPHWVAFLPLIIWLGVFIRIQNLPLLQNEIPLGLDPHYFLRIAQHLAEYGSLPEYDMMRYVPLGVLTAKELLLVPWFSYAIFKVVSIFIPAFTIEFAHILYPVIAFAIGLVFFYLLAREVSGTKQAILSVLILAVIPAFLRRTTAGFADKEALGMIFLFASLFFLLKAYNSASFFRTLNHSIFSGIAAGILCLTWGGYQFLAAICALATMLLWYCNQMNTNRIIGYTVWSIVFSGFLAFGTPRYGGITGLFKSTTVALFVGVAILLLVDRALKNKLPQLPLPRQLIVTFILGLVGIIGIATVLGTDRLVDLFSGLTKTIATGLAGERFARTIAESRQPYLSNWVSSFKLFLVLFLAGLWYIVHSWKKHIGKSVYLLEAGLFAYTLGLLVSRASPYGSMTGETVASAIVLFGGILLFILSVISFFVYLYVYQKKHYNKLTEIHRGYVFLFALSVILFLAARGGLRIFFVLSFAICIVSAIFIVAILKKINQHNDVIIRGAGWFIVLIIVVPLIWTSLSASLTTATYSAPSFNKQWQDATYWASTSTDEDSVFAHWWDYGYWIQTGAKRATVLDGGNFITYWNHLMARTVLSSNNTHQALQFLSSHNASHLLIVSDEIAKYPAYSSIGSDEAFDILSWIGTYVMIPQLTTQDANVRTYTFRGSTKLDQELLYKDRIYPKDDSVISLIRIPVQDDDNPETAKILQPRAVVSYAGGTQEVPVSCIYDDGEWIYFNSTENSQGLDGCLRIIPRFLNQRYQQQNGALLYVSDRGRQTLWTRLFLFEEEIPEFELVYDDSSRYQLAVYGGSVIGPLKIWKINYDNFTLDPIAKEFFTNTTSNWWDHVTK